MRASIPLPPRWARWKRNRVQELTAAGVSLKAAMSFAGHEVRSRERLVPILGFARAAEAALVCLDEQQGRFGLRGETAGLRPDQIAGLERASARILIAQ